MNELSQRIPKRTNVHESIILLPISDHQEISTTTADLSVKSHLLAPTSHPTATPFVRLFRGSSWTLAGTVAAQGIALAVTVLLARYIGKAAFGQFGMIQSTALTLVGIAGAGFGITAARYLSLYRTTDPARGGRILGMLTVTAACTGGLFATALILFSPQIASRAFNSPSLSSALTLGSPYVLLMTLNGLQLGALAGLEAFKESAFMAVTQASFNAVCVFFCAQNWGLNGAVAALSVSSLFSFLLYHAVLVKCGRKHGISITYKDAWKEKAAFTSFGLPAAISGIVGNIAIWGCYAITVNTAAGFKELGAIAAANYLRQTVLFVPSIVTRVALPINCNQHGEGRPIKSVINRQFQFTIAFAALAALVVISCGPYVLRLYGKEFASDTAVLTIFCCVAVCEVAAANLSQVLVIFNKLWFQVWAMGLWSIALVGTSYVFMHTYRPSIAVALGYLVAWLFSLLLYGALARKLLASK